MKPTETAANIELLKEAPQIVANAVRRGWVKVRRPLTDSEIDQAINQIGKYSK